MPLVNKTFSDIITFTRASTATYFDSAGTLQSAAIDTPRFDYDPSTLAARGFLIEEARTNLLLQSEDFATTWTATRANITTNTSVAPDGTTTADALIEDNTAANTHNVGQGFSFTAGLTYTISVFAKATASPRFLQIIFPSGAFGATRRPVFDLVNGTAAAATDTTASIENVGDGWYRCIASMQAASTNSASPQFQLAETYTNSNPLYDGDNTSGLYIWGAQLEAGAFPTSYIPTTTTALTRSADEASVNTLSPWYNQTEGTLYAEYQTYSASVTQIAVALMDSSNGSSNRVTVGHSATAYNGAMVDGGAVQASLTQGTTSTNVVKNAFAFAVNDFAFSVNGAAPATDTSGTVSSAFIEMQLGKRGSVSPMSGWLQRVTYYPRRVSNAELQALTA